MSPTDAYSGVDSFELKIIAERKEFAHLSEIQNIPIETNLKEDIENRERLARQATKAFWESVDTPEKWETYIEQQKEAHKNFISMTYGINETVAIAHMKAAKGIIVYKAPDGKSYRKHVKEAVAFRERLEKDFPDVFTERLPIFSYDPNNLEHQLTELTPEKLRRPDTTPSSKAATRN